MKSENIEILKRGGVGVIPTDTVYGLACSAFLPSALLRLFSIKGRAENKPPVIIIAKVDDLKKFGANITPKHAEFIKKYWPGQVTIIFEIAKEFDYLDKGLGLAIRLPADKSIGDFLEKTGPLATSSANLQGQSPAVNIEEAKKYFGQMVDFYEDGGELNSKPSTLVKIDGNEIKVLRQGAVII